MCGTPGNTVMDGQGFCVPTVDRNLCSISSFFFLILSLKVTILTQNLDKFFLCNVVILFVTMNKIQIEIQS